jgi:hypothetical protein
MRRPSIPPTLAAQGRQASDAGVKLALLALALCLSVGCSTPGHSDPASGPPWCGYYVIVDGGLPNAGDGGTDCFAICDADVSCETVANLNLRGLAVQVSCSAPCP